MTIAGIDVSSWQPKTNWDQVAASGIQFAAVKATEGTAYSNPYFPRDWAEVQRVGLVRIAYHYAQPDMSSPEADAQYFLYHIGPLQPGDCLALDIETGSGNLLDWTLRFLKAVEAAVGFKPLFYSGLWFMEPHGLTGSTELATYGLWLAAYQPQTPVAPSPWPFWAIWQNSSTGNIPGVNGLVDLDLFNGTASQLRAYGKPETPPKPVKQPTNDDLVAAGKLLLAADIAGTIAYLQPFTGAKADAVEPPSISAVKRHRPAGNAQLLADA